MILSILSSIQLARIVQTDQRDRQLLHSNISYHFCERSIYASKHAAHRLTRDLKIERCVFGAHYTLGYLAPDFGRSEVPGQVIEYFIKRGLHFIGGFCVEQHGML
jgi:hypothetical protein